MRLAIGDIHGRPYWKNYLDEDFTEFYCVGDYFDTHSRSMGFDKQYRNFIAICAAARKDPRLKLCFGNHDYHYIRGVTSQCYSGFQEVHSRKISDILEQNMDLLKVVYVTNDNYIISHAGVTDYFLKSLGIENPQDINGAFERDRNILNFNGIDNYGDDITQSPIWIRPGSLLRAALPGYSQIVGHTPMEEITEHSLPAGHKVAFIDTYDTESIYRF